MFLIFVLCGCILHTPLKTTGPSLPVKVTEHRSRRRSARWLAGSPGEGPERSAAARANQFFCPGHRHPLIFLALLLPKVQPVQKVHKTGN